MNRKAILDKISQLIVSFQAEVEANNRLNLTDINIHAENFLIPLLKLVYGWDLKNTNLYSSNSPAIDLEDEESRIAIQVTSTGTSAKIKKTLVKYKTHHGSGKHDQLLILILTKKQKKYVSEDVVRHADEVLAFNLDEGIIDLSDVLKEIHGLHSLDKIKEILELLQTELSESKIEQRKRSLRGIVEETIEVYQTNLVKVTIPSVIFRYAIEVDRLSVIRKSWKTSWKLQSKASSFEVFKRAVHFLGAPDIPAYYQNGTYLYSFEDITNTSLATLCAPGSQVELDVHAFSSEDVANEKNVVGLLNSTLVKDLKVKGVNFRWKEGLFFFTKGANEEARNISYVLEVSASRNVVTPMFKDADGNPKVYKHLAFKTNFIKSDKHWFMSMRPTWVFTTDGYHLSAYNSDQISEQKRLENNQQVNNAFELIRYCINNQIDVDQAVEYNPVLAFQAVPPVSVKLKS